MLTGGELGIPVVLEVFNTIIVPHHDKVGIQPTSICLLSHSIQNYKLNTIVSVMWWLTSSQIHQSGAHIKRDERLHIEEVTPSSRLLPCGIRFPLQCLSGVGAAIYQLPRCRRSVRVLFLMFSSKGSFSESDFLVKGRLTWLVPPPSLLTFVLDWITAAR